MANGDERDVRQPIRILHILDNLDDARGGSLHALIALSNMLSSEEVVSDIATTTDPKDRHAAMSGLDARVDVHMFRRRFPKHFSFSPGLARFLRRSTDDFDLIHLHVVFSFPALYSAHYSRRSGKPMLLRPHGSLDPFDLRKHSRIKRIIGPIYTRWLIRTAATILCTSEREAEDLETYGARPRVAVLPLPVPQARLEKTSTGTEEPPESPYFLFMGRIDYKKGLPILLEAFKNVCVYENDLLLVLAGRGTEAYEAQVRRIVNELGLESRVRFPGWISGEQKLTYMRRAIAFVLISDNENFGLSVVECLQQSCPVVISDQVYLSGELDAAGAALVVRRDVAEVINALQRIREDDSLRRRLASAGDEFVREQLGSEVLRARHLSLVRGLLHQSRR